MKSVKLTASITAAEFCALEGIGQSTFFKLKQQGLAPEFYWIPGTTVQRLTPEKHREWRAMMDRHNKKKARQLERERAKRSKTASYAGKLGALSPGHPANRRKKPRAARKAVV